MSAKRRAKDALDAADLAAQQASDLPTREVMSLLDPNAVGGALLGDPTTTTTGGDAATTDPTTSPAGQPLADSTSTATQTGAQGTDLAKGALPDLSTAAGQTYQPNATSTATS